MIKPVLKALPAALAAVALFATPAVLSAPAHAATASTGRLPAGDDVYRDWFTSHSNCVSAGQGGIDRGHWGHYTCSEGDWFWHLWTDR
ncbi:hypothetical protein [Microtetraspora malaysiensis]|uniref:hypothetical protein n=1 Tax=Microtetraspora malaysiensis TaxID=161358 RepID=UPI00082D96E7|nr:hypothetical protein [Microtetraspora malaysiensis]